MRGGRKLEMSLEGYRGRDRGRIRGGRRPLWRKSLVRGQGESEEERKVTFSQVKHRVSFVNVPSNNDWTNVGLG